MSAAATRRTSADEQSAAAARAYAARGWPIFPLWPIRADGRCGCNDRNCGNAGKHPCASGWQNTIASVSAAESSWGARHGPRGIGLACGPRAGLWGLDVDPAHGGVESINALQREHGPLPTTATSRTGSGGWHLIFAWPTDDGRGLRNSVGRIAAGLDVRGEAGYLVLPPSSHHNGATYRWLLGPAVQQPALAPVWLVELARDACADAVGRLKTERIPVEMCPRGKWHPALTSLCGLLRHWGAGPEVLDAAAVAFVTHQCEHDDIPIDWGRVHKTAADIARRY